MSFENQPKNINPDTQLAKKSVDVVTELWDILIEWTHQIHAFMEKHNTSIHLFCKSENTPLGQQVHTLTEQRDIKISAIH